jgi:hypothetical protein
MKKLLVFPSLTGCLIFVSITMNAQKTTQGDNPQVNKSTTGSSVSSAPPIQLVLQNDNTEQSKKAIIPGGEFKPKDTRVNNLYPAAVEPAGYEISKVSPIPLMPKVNPVAPPVTKKEIKKAGPVLQQ